MSKTVRHSIFVSAIILFSALLLCATLFAVEAKADDASCGNFAQWSFDDNSGTLTVTGTGSMYTYSSESQWPWHSLRLSIKHVVIEEGIETVGRSSFMNCPSLVSVKLPDTVKTVERYAFSNCNSLNSVTIPSNVTKIDMGAFNCYNLVEVINKSSLTIKKGDSTNGSIALKALTVHSEDKSKLVTLDGFVFYTAEEADPAVTYLVGCTESRDVLVLPSYNGGYSINRYAFRNRTDIKQIAVSDGVSGIGNNAFEGCTTLRTVYIPKSTETIGTGAFEGCSSLSTVYFEGTDKEWNSVSEKAGISSTASVITDHVHSFGGWIEDKPATEEEEGSRRRECSDCAYSEVEAIAKLQASAQTALDSTVVEIGHNKYTPSYASADVNITFVIVAFVGAFVSIGVVMFTKTKD